MGVSQVASELSAGAFDGGPAGGAYGGVARPNGVDEAADDDALLTEIGPGGRALHRTRAAGASQPDSCLALSLRRVRTGGSAPGAAARGGRGSSPAWLDGVGEEREDAGAVEHGVERGRAQRAT